jgi:Na+(H+)/acetate symporter ActP
MNSATIDPWILSFSVVTVVATLGLGFWAARRSKTAHDFFVAGRRVSVGWNASAISGEYLSAASFMGVAGMVMSSGYDALWYPVGYACGYLFLLLFIAGPLRRFGAYTIPDFAEGRFDSPLFRKIAVVFVLFIGFFYTMPQMKGAGTTLAYIFPGLPYWAGVVVVGAVITVNVALGGMKGITLVQAFQYWLKMFAIAVPVFALMAVYGHYGRQLAVNAPTPASTPTAAEVHQPGSDRAFGGDPVVDSTTRRPLPAKAPNDSVWLSPFGPLTTKAAKAAAAALTNDAPVLGRLPLRADLASDTYMTVNLGDTNLTQALATYAELTGRTLLPRSESPLARVDDFLGGRLSQWGLVTRHPSPRRGVFYHRDGLVSAIEVKDALEALLRHHGLVVVPVGEQYFRTVQVRERNGGRESAAEAVQRDWLERYEKPLALLYTYSLIVALVCGTAGLPHILVRFYTNPDGAAAKRTTLWVMVLIGVFYLFPPIFGVMGRNLSPELYEGAGAKGTDKVVLELPRVLNPTPDAPTAGVGAPAASEALDAGDPASAMARRPGFRWGSLLSGITCAGAFAAFMSTFSGLLVSMTGALAHDVYGRMLRPRSTPEQRLRAFKLAAIVIGGVATLLGTCVEPLQINFMVGQAFAIAAASYFPLLFVSCWWRGLTMKGAATGMLAGGIASVLAVTLTNFSDLTWLPLGGFWAAHPLLRILCEQPALWAVPLAIGLMVVVSRLTARDVPADVRMKMLVLHAPEKLGLKQEYIQEHQAGHA